MIRQFSRGKISTAKILGHRPTFNQNNSECVIELNAKHKTINILEDNIKSKSG
jgi:hypothetical protein